MTDYSSIMRLIFLYVFFLSLLACSSSTPPAPISPAPQDDTLPLPIDRRNPKTKDPAKMESCSKMGSGPACEEDKKCEDICDDIFSTRSDKKECYRFSTSLVADFEALLDFAEDGDFDEIKPQVLECMLDIDERPFAKVIRKEISRNEAKEALYTVANDDVLAEVFEEEDDEFNILKTLLNKAANNNNLIDQLQQEIEDNKSFLYYAGSYGDSIWKWMNSYVDDVCDRSSASCLGGEPLNAYCTALLDFKEKDLEDFLSDADLFAEEYEDEVEDADYLYEVEDNPGDREGDFRDWCRVQIAAHGPCPDLDNGDSLPSSKKLGDITLVDAAYNANMKAYVISGGYCHNPAHSLRGAGGTIDPSNNLLLHISNYPELHLNDNILQYNSDTTYYLYIKKGETQTRYNLGVPGDAYKDTCEGRDGVQIRRWDHNSTDGDLTRTPLIFGDGTGTFSIWLAGEKDGRCSYYTAN